MKKDLVNRIESLESSFNEINYWQSFKDELSKFAEACGETIPEYRAPWGYRSALDTIIVDMPERFTVSGKNCEVAEMEAYWSEVRMRGFKPEEIEYLKELFAGFKKWVAYS